MAIDIVGGKGSLPTTRSGCRYILTVVDLFTRWAEAFPLANQKATTIARTLVRGWICRYGVPYRVLSDQGRNVDARKARALASILQSHKTHTVAFKPSTNGACERFNRTLKQMLVRLTNDRQDSWDELLPHAMLAYRSTVHRGTGFTPFRLLFGREI